MYAIESPNKWGFLVFKSVKCDFLFSWLSITIAKCKEWCGVCLSYCLKHIIERLKLLVDECFWCASFLSQSIRDSLKLEGRLNL